MKKMHNSKLTKLLCLVLSLMMILGAAPLTASAADHVHVDADKNNICDGCSKELYIVRSWDATNKKVVDTLTEIPADAVTLESSDVAITISAGTTYVVAGSVTCTVITVSGTPDSPTNLIVKDGAALTAKKGIIVTEGKEIRFFGQSKDSGTVNASGQTRASGIGCLFSKKAGNVTIHGGNIIATGSSSGSGIGSCANYASGATVIYGGTVTATGNGAYPGINTTVPGSCTIYGGKVVATSNREAAGIGTCGFKDAESGPITIYGGNVTAQSINTASIQSAGAGIGGGPQNPGAAFTMYGGTVTAFGSEEILGDSVTEYAAGIGASTTKYDGEFDMAQGTIVIDGEPVIKSGYTAEDAKATTLEDYILNRDRYVYIHLHDFSGEAKNIGGKHAYKCTGCDLYGNEEDHTFEDGTCTVCGAADKITASELCALLKGQKFVNSDGLVLSIMDYGTVIAPMFGTDTLSLTSSTTKVPVTSYGYTLTVQTTSSTNVFDFYTDADGFSKVVCSGLKVEERNGEYYPYHPVTEVTVKDATCTEDGATTAYWICTDEGCGKAFTDVSCKTEIPADTLATYIIPATGHDFTGEYVPGTGDNVGKHARKCVNTGCTAVGLETTANAYEACTGMEDDFTCDVCGYVDEAAAAAAALAEAKAEAAVAVELLGTGDDSDEVAAIIEKALADIEKAESIAAVEAIADTAAEDVAEQRAAEAAAAALAAAKTEAKATVNALAEGASDAVKAIVEKAVEDIEAAASESAVNSIVSNAKNKVNAQKNLENLIASKKAEVSAALAEAKCDEAREILTKALADLDNVTDQSSAYSVPAIAIGSAKGKDSQYTGMLSSYINAFVNALSVSETAAEDNYLDYIVPALENCTSIAALSELFAAEEDWIDFYRGKDNAETRYATSLSYNGITDETKALIAEAVEKILASETPDELKAVCEEYDMPIYVASLKDKNTYHVLALATENDSEEVTAIIEKALADIEAGETLDEVDDAYVTAYYAVAAQRQIEAEALAEAKAEAAAAVELLGTGDDSDEVADIIEKALADIEDATSVDAVEAIAAAAEKDVADQRAAEEAAAALAEAKAEAKAAVEALAADGDSDEVTAIIEKALADIEAAEDIAAVEALADAAETDVADQKAAEAAAALADAKAEAKTAVEALADDTASDEVKAIIEKAVADIEAAEDIAAVEAIAEAAETDVAEQVAAEEAAAEAAKALADAKEAAKAEIDAAVAGDTDEAVTAAADEAKAAIDAAETIEEVEAAKTAGLEKVADASGRCPYCGNKEHENIIDKFVCIIYRIITRVAMVFNFGKSIVK